MFYVDSQRTLTRRDSSLMVSKPPVEDKEYDWMSSGRTHSTARLGSESNTSFPMRPRGSVRKELVAMLFESMLNNVVESWDVILPTPQEESPPIIYDGKSPSELTFFSKKKKFTKEPPAPAPAKQSKTRRRSSKLELLEQTDPLQQCWWSCPDERAKIRFKNGNTYEGSMSMKCMHGEGRYQWTDGTVYLGQFKDNEMKGKGRIHWKDDTWYEGDFVGNIRHGEGLYVDSRKQSSYAGGWHCGTKHGEGVIHYSSFTTDNYDGEWVHNVRHGFGSREYSDKSCYKGEWDTYIREGKGLMIWPNSDFYKGTWKNGVMSGYGIYIWDTWYNNSMSLPSINAYRGIWKRGGRSEYGLLNLGLGLGSHYKGEFKNNNKHGAGRLVTNNGFILQDKHLFTDDNLGPASQKSENNNSECNDPKGNLQHIEPYSFNICDDSVGLTYHIEKAFQNIDNKDTVRANMIHEYLEHNKVSAQTQQKPPVLSSFARKDHNRTTSNPACFNLENRIKFEEISLRMAIACYETELKNIYYLYSTICNTHEIYFTPIMIRLYLWQFYYDCNVHEKGLNLVEIDRMFHHNPEWLSRYPHNPFEKIYFWQFLQNLISVAIKLYAKRKLPGVKPDTILASAFRTFMKMSAIPGAGRRKGHLVNGYGPHVPLKGAYELYRSLGEPHTVRTFLCAVRRAPHYQESQPALVETTDEATPFGRNAYIIGDEMTFITDEVVARRDENESHEDKDKDQVWQKLKLFNFGNLSSRTIIKIFSHIYPNLYCNGKIMNLDVEMTFYEFFEAFVSCAEESVRVKEEELRWREKFHTSKVTVPRPSSSVGSKVKY